MDSFFEKNYDLLAYEYMCNNGFEPENYQEILELVQPVDLSLTKYVDNNENMFLLSNKVNYDELVEFSIKGACGEIEDREIVVPRSLAADKYFEEYGEKRLCLGRRGYDVPQMSDIDLILAYAKSSWSDAFDLISTLSLEEQEKYLIFMFNLQETLTPEHKLFEDILLSLRQARCYVSADTVREENKRIYLVKKAGKRSTFNSMGNISFYD